MLENLITKLRNLQIFCTDTRLIFNNYLFKKTIEAPGEKEAVLEIVVKPTVIIAYHKMSRE